MFIWIFQFKASNRLSNDELTLRTHDMIKPINRVIATVLMKCFSNLSLLYSDTRGLDRIHERFVTKISTVIAISITAKSIYIHLFSSDNFILCRNVVKIAENTNSRFRKGCVINVGRIQRWFVKYKTSDFRSENKPGRRIKRSWNIRF